MKHKPKKHPTKKMGRDSGTGKFIPRAQAEANKKGATVDTVKMVLPKRKKKARKKGRR